MTLHQHSFLKYSPSEHGTIHEKLKVDNEKAPSLSGWELFHLMSKMEGAPLDRPFLPKSRSANLVRLQTGLDVLLDSKANKKRSKIILLRSDHKGRFFCLRCGYRKLDYGNYQLSLIATGQSTCILVFIFRFARVTVRSEQFI